MKIEGDAFVSPFDHAAGMTAKGGTLQGFSIAGADKKFVWADARIEGNTVVGFLAAGQAASRGALRLGQQSGGHLYNAAGLPALPFRTDIN
jgi:sialate O-acetylesterase